MRPASALLLLGLGLAGGLRPTDPNVCSFWESFTTVVKESYAHPFVQPPARPCEDPLDRFRTCHQPTIVYRTAYRQAVRTAQRQRLRCCQGYYESSGVCVPLCSRECVHGRCLSPERCQCEPGWRGVDCSSRCGASTWGPSCRQRCDCGPEGTCDPQSGACSCPAGLRAPRCRLPCPPGTYGPACRWPAPASRGRPATPPPEPASAPPGTAGPICEVSCANVTSEDSCPSTCPCQNGGVCQPGTGHCDCPPGWTGAICSQPCPEGRFGRDCREACLCHNQARCDPVTGHCLCAQGYTGERCQEECPVGRYGQDCSEVVDCAEGARCFARDGSCLCEHGYSGERCDQPLCPPGSYGLGCPAPCECHPGHSLSCHPMSGECRCAAGWAGLQCNESCPQGQHGPGCREPCLCLHGGTCRPDTGLCLCTPGYTGAHCASLCPADTFGPNCSERCSCLHAFGCSPVDGACVCKEGWQAGNCSVPCAPGTWGFGCNASCQCAHGAACRPDSGSCACTPGWHGPRCRLPCPVRRPASARAGAKRCDCERAARLPARWTAAASASPDGQVSGPRLPDFRHRTNRGPRCGPALPQGLWGPGCNSSCTCKNGGTCDAEDGSCACAPGFRGSLLPARPAPPARYGKRCCSVPCKLLPTRRPAEKRGRAASGPLTGFFPPVPVCPRGSGGPDCARTCPCHHEAPCDPRDGSCSCPGGWSGRLCSEGTRTDRGRGSQAGSGRRVPRPPGRAPSPLRASVSSPGTGGWRPGEGLKKPRRRRRPQSCRGSEGFRDAPVVIGIPRQPLTVAPAPPDVSASAGAAAGVAAAGVAAPCALAAGLLAFVVGYRRWKKGKIHRRLTAAYGGGRPPASEYAVPEAPPGSSHYYSNPSYHTLSRCSPRAPLPIKMPGRQMFSLGAPDRPGAFGPDGRATLPADWKRLGGAPPGHRQRDFSHGHSYSLGPFYRKGGIPEEGPPAAGPDPPAVENPYATIRDLPGLPGGPGEGGYVEMKGPGAREDEAPGDDGERPPPGRRDSGTYERPDPCPSLEPGPGGARPPAPPGLPPGHYDSPKNSHVPGHYDLPPVRRPPSPPRRPQHR
ncbi:LOW QUALITY PROTEIN: platelet endothelial aggregation receptor 1 [Ornithorhynchus anatinus]|uniref:LOW QUALITY PROTEIN: platelet endothelial aggregation receptor 1 n=1 Tax=Ornithorhynchus anatinus TaxID=9258 RepID=UPI0019D480BB|nr:LOW QUALITY PROTEIN: platelet endothelial aggregation receptor 1 [Ornithorhynchus anatinus]